MRTEGNSGNAARSADAGRLRTAGAGRLTDLKQVVQVQKHLAFRLRLWYFYLLKLNWYVETNLTK